MSRTVATDAEILARWKEEPAPLLPLLHAFHDRDGFLSESSIRGVAETLRIPLADLYGTITFYHFFRTFPPGKARALKTALDGVEHLVDTEWLQNEIRSTTT